VAGSFFDTNVLLYVASCDAAKADRAEKVIGDGGTISVQVLNEVASEARRKMRLSWAETRAMLATFQDLLPVRPITVDIHEAGVALAERYGLSVYDAMIAASALDAGCDTLWSEDMQDGLVLDGQVRIVNPFHVGQE
jgi:predicted nucleic acid-binding protein